MILHYSITEVQLSPGDVWIWASNYAINYFSSLISDTWVNIDLSCFLCPIPTPMPSFLPCSFLSSFSFPFSFSDFHGLGTTCFRNSSPVCYNIMEDIFNIILLFELLLVFPLNQWHISLPWYNMCCGSIIDGRYFLGIWQLIQKDSFGLLRSYCEHFLYVAFSSFFPFVMISLIQFIFSCFYSFYFCEVYQIILGTRVG